MAGVLKSVGVVWLVRRHAGVEQRAGVCVGAHSGEDGDIIDLGERALGDLGCSRAGVTKAAWRGWGRVTDTSAMDAVRCWSAAKLFRADTLHAGVRGAAAAAGKLAAGQAGRTRGGCVPVGRSQRGMTASEEGPGMAQLGAGGLRVCGGGGNGG